MATETSKRVIVVDVKGSKEAVSHLRQLQKHAKSADTNIARMGKTLGQIGFTMKAFIAYRLTAYVSGIGPAFINAADSVSLMKSRLEIANGEMGDTTKIMEELFEVAERSRTSIDAVSTLYTRMTVASKELGASQKEVIDFTELVSNTFLLSGASAGEAASGVTQISQAMAKGKLDGDEFKSIMENNIYFGKLLAKTLGVTRGELNAMSEAGKITADKLLDMGENIEQVRADVDKMPTTFEQAKTAWGNAVARMISDSDTLTDYMSGRFKVLRDLANDISDNFDDSTSAKIIEQEKQLNDLISRRQKLEQEQFQSTGFLDGVFNTQGKLQNSIDVVNQRIEKTAENIKRLKDLQADLLDKEQGNIEISLPGAAKPDETFTDWLKDVQEESAKANKELNLFYPKLEQLDQMFFNGDLAESVYNKELEKLTGKLTEASGGMSEFQEAQEKLAEVADSLKSPIEQLADEMSRLDEIAARFPQLSSEVAVLQEKMAKGFEPENAKNEWLDWGNTAQTAVKGVTDSFIDMALTGKSSFEDFAKSFLVNIAKMITQQAVLNALSGTSFGSAIGLKASAKGNAFDHGNIIPFASGGVVDSPTFFPMASSVGLMGEAGPEAILPLKRSRTGDLGVSAQASNVQVNIHNNSGSEASVKQTEQNGISVIDIVVGEVTNNLSKDISRGSGPLAQTLEGTYGLNRVAGSYS